MLNRGRPYARPVRDFAPIVEEKFDQERSAPSITSFWLWQGIWKRKTDGLEHLGESRTVVRARVAGRWRCAALHDRALRIGPHVDVTRARTGTTEVLGRRSADGTDGP
jgi:hypothetical protein